MSVASNNIRLQRKQRNWSQESLAKELGLSIATISKIETGVTDITYSRLLQFAKIFDTPLVDLLYVKTKLNTRDNDLRQKKDKLTDLTEEVICLRQKVIGLMEEITRLRLNQSAAKND